MTGKASDAPGRTHYLPVPESFRLEQTCSFISRALNETCYLVGSSLHSRGYRDVDIRVIMDDAKFEALFGKTGPNCSYLTQPFWSLFNTAVSEYMHQATGLPVDFQVHKASDTHDEDKSKRIVFGFVSARDLDPAWAVTDP